MSRFRATWLVAGREIREAFRRRSFWAIVGILFLGSCAAMIVPALLSDRGRTHYTVAVVGGSPSFDALVTATVRDLDADVTLRDSADEAVARGLVDKGHADVGIVTGDQPTIIVRANDHDRLVGALQQALAVDALSSRLSQVGLTPDQVHQALATQAATVDRLDPGKASRFGASLAISFVLYLLLLTLMMQVANGTAIEKANRISEVLLAIVRPGALLFGKVLGLSLTGVMALLAGLLPVVTKLALGGDLPAGLGSAVAAGALWFVLGLALYLTLAGALGALVERQEEAGSAVSPLMFMLIGTFVVMQGGADSPLGRVLAYVPFSSPLVVPARLAIGVSSPVEVIGSLVIGVVTVVVAGRFGAAVYARAIVRTGRRLKLSEVLRTAR
jgi:ABC-2 type transport system permease protein